MLKRVCNIIIFGGLLISYSTAHAEFDETSLFLQLSGDEELISIATGTPRPLSKAPAVASIITANDIKASGAKTVQEALEKVPGLHIGVSTLNRLKPVYSIRGIQTANNPHTLILFNGNEIPDTFSGSVLPNLYMPVENIARIEIIRGPGSAVYGADAFAGVINIITKKSTDINGFQAGIKAGSFDTQQVWAQYGGEHNGWHIAASVEAGHSNGDRSRKIDSDLQTTFDGIFSTSASLAPGALDTRFKSLVTGLTVSKGNWQAQFNAWNQRDTGNGAGIANALDPTGRTNIDQYLLSLEYENKNWRPNWEIKALASYEYSDLDAKFNIFPSGATLPIGSDGNLNFTNSVGLVNFSEGFIGNPISIAKIARFDLTTQYNGFQSQSWRFNVGVKRIKQTDKETKNFGPGVIDGTVSPIDGTLTNVTDTPFIFHLGSSRTVSYVSVQDEWQFAPDWLFTGGVRYDNYSDVGSTVNPRLSLVWNTRQDLTTKLLYGRAFRAPTFGELAAVNNPITLGNPDLDPEIINSIELAFDYRPTPTLRGTLNLFHYNIQGLIEFVDDDGVSGGSSTAQNNKDQSAEGLELELIWQATKKLTLSGSAALQNATDDDTGDKIADAPRKQLQFTANWRFMPQWSAQLDAFRIMDRPRAANDTREEIDDYTWVNLTANGKKVIKGVDVQLSVRNLFDTDAREPGPTSISNDYPLEGRSVYLGLSSEF